MKPLIISLLVLIANISHGQKSDVLFIDNNPKVTKEEAIWLNANFPIDNFDYSGKFIDFVDLKSGGYWGIGKWTFRFHKKNLKKLDLKQVRYRYFIFTPAEKAKTRGYDAQLIIANKNIRGKLKRLKREKAHAYLLNRYPQIPVDAGVDNNALLSPSNSIFFNELNKAELRPDPPFDFTGKKVAIFSNACWDEEKIVRISISEYVTLIKKQLDDNGFSNAYPTYYLNAEQKLETGYDVVIHNPCKMRVPLDTLLKKLK